MLIPSKLVCSYRLKNSVKRQGLLKKLDKSEQYSLVLVNAPAGYGKTTLISQWMTNQKNVGWYSLDESDNQSERFASYFGAALEHATGNLLPQINIIERKSNLLSLFSQLLINISDIKQHFYLVIDDYHLIDNEEIHEALKYWLKHQPESMTLILISRSVPPIGITSLRVQEQILEIDVQDLPFNHQESIEFFQSRLNDQLPENEITSLCDEVEGWPTALQLISLSAKQQNKKLQDAAKRLSNIHNYHINEYLNDEVLESVDDETKSFILQCSVLRTMNETLVKEVTGCENSLTKLEALEKQGLFLQRMDSEDNWWRFHPLFASFLSYCSHIQFTKNLPVLHQRAAKAWLKLGYVTEALYHANQLENYQEVLTILSSHGWKLFHQGELKLLEESLSHIPDIHLVSNPNLVLLKAWLAQSQHRYDEVNGIFAHFDVIFEQKDVHLSIENQAEFNTLRAQVAINQGDENKALDLATKALEHLPENAYYARIVATSIIGEAYHCHGNFDEALTMLKKAEKMGYQYNTSHNILWSLLQQAEILIAQGFLQAGYDMLDKAMLFVKTNHLQKIPMYEFLLRLKGQILWDWYNLDKAEAMASTGMEVLSKDEERLQCIALLCKISIARGNLDNASRLLKQINQLQNAHHYHYDWNANADQVKIVLWQMTNDLDATEAWLIQNKYPTTDKNHFTQVQWRNIARAQIMLGQFEQAQTILDRVIKTGEELQLISDLNRALILRNRLYFLQNKKAEAQKDLIDALNLSRQTNFISVFVIEGEIMAQQIRHLLQMNILDELASHKAKFILRNINQHARQKFAHFDEQFVENLLKNPEVPELLKISPLTQREWQVLGLIYSGYSNEQISEELQVAITTIKTHIRNLYQKIGVSNRNEAINYTKNLLQLMGYNS
ncbi:LuxR family maltose regulon positive regulatory protein [Bisgaardia hudsonensis]|uniref:HTH-type transcriptional regulator MalT n=1 Tax=Bisgaardia hudsonensis TaxID=109472 RepID=A0A4R2MZV8_9PAST|nr:HTH-type transcriptional regulator MalT [Bisgaardia hudsonensis]QLB13802.1 transcriptional regulator MalT [Bisgaardia hudsonensis]TCP11715.1 LuxR family maltose regulon positive regulatory protein [Bisgaardia hudsonensis]